MIRRGIRCIPIPKTVLLLAFACHLLFLPLPSRAQSQDRVRSAPLLAIGTVPISGHNPALAKKRAVSQALNKGMEAYIVRRLGDRDLIQNLDRIAHEVIPVAGEGIQNFNILAEQRSQDQYTVLVRIKVNEEIVGDMLRDAGIVLTPGPAIKILLLVSEITGGDIAYWWQDPQSAPALTATEVALFQAFQDRGFHPVNRSLNPPFVTPGASMTSPEPSIPDLLEWGRRFDAHMVIYGQCQMADPQKISLSLNALHVDQEMLICQESGVAEMDAQEAPSKAKNQALRQLVRQLIAELGPCIMRAVAEERGKRSQIHITLEGIHTYKQFMRLRTFLQQDIAGVERVTPSRIKENSISAIVEFQGDRETFTTRVLNHQRPPFVLRVGQKQAGHIVFDIE
ncbi:MAG: hypothetical protein K9L83_02880 [Deltaproteobacteria bacterium]|nr:hypothetical protein [Deltaproteobacteria bacterium]